MLIPSEHLDEEFPIDRVVRLEVDEELTVWKGVKHVFKRGQQPDTLASQRKGHAIGSVAICNV